MPLGVVAAPLFGIKFLCIAASANLTFTFPLFKSVISSLHPDQPTYKGTLKCKGLPPPASASGYTLQVLTRSSLRAFRCYPSAGIQGLFKGPVQKTFSGFITPNCIWLFGPFCGPDMGSQSQPSIQSAFRYEMEAPSFRA